MIEDLPLGFDVDESHPDYSVFSVGPMGTVEYIGGKIREVGMYGPTAILHRYKPTNPLTWLIHGLVSFFVTLVWLVTVTWWLATIGIIIEHIGASWRKMKQNQ